MLTGKKLIADVDSCQLKPGELALWWLGQLGFIVKMGKTVAYLDAYLTPKSSRLVPPLLKPEQVANAAFICGTHDHGDHIDRSVWPALAAAAPTAKFVVPDLLREMLARELGIPLERFIGLDDGKTMVAAAPASSGQDGGLKISAVAAAHEFLDQDPASGRYPHLGYILEGNGCTLYHSGDCCIYEGLQTKLRRWRFDVVMLPINGRDAQRLSRNCIGNMTYQEAADLAGALQPRLTIPGHYDMFEGNLGDPAAFGDYMQVKYSKLKVHVCGHGRRFVLGRD